MITRRAVLLTLLAAPAVISGPSVAFAASPPVFVQHGAALGGTDAVAYFTQGEPVRGGAGLTHEWNGARWQFSSAEHRDAFAAEPERYAPAYGGYCAWAVSQGYLADTVRDAWTIYDGRLYLNANLRIRRRWERDIPGFLAQSEANWPGVLA
jgi:hypothetical protein